jgi:hypothetical protein
MMTAPPPDTDALLREASAGDAKARELLMRHQRRLLQLIHLRMDRRLAARIDASRPSREWLEEYYFALTAYGVHAGRFPSLGRLNLLAGYVSAGVACARFLWAREDRLAGGRALSTENPS